MKKYAIISTYPEQGSKNIGDALITKSLITAIKYVKNNEDIHYEIIWRESPWENIKSVVENADLIIFACLALRPYMHKREYPALENIINSGVPIAVISAGTHFNIGDNFNNSYFDSFSKDSLRLIKELNKKALFFTTRGALSQRFCKYHDLDRVEFTGDIAFFGNEFKDIMFHKRKIKDIRKIAISDPHRAKMFLPLFERLIEQCRDTFFNAEITCLIHGKNGVIKDKCIKENVLYREIYLDKESGLDEYSNYDMHVGFRVHGHVSALKRRVISYLIEQDGRGCDYGLSLSRKVTVPSHKVNRISKELLKNIIKKILKRKPGNLEEVRIDYNSADEIISLIQNDAIYDFDKFIGIEKELNMFSEKCLEALKKLS